MKYLMLTLFMFSCGAFNTHKKEDTISETDRLKIKYSNYLEWSKSQLDSNNFVKADCDSLTFTALYKAAGGKVDLKLAEDTDDKGRYYRRPAKDCYKESESGSSDISQDAYIMLALQLLLERDQKSTQAILDYADKYNRVMGRGPTNITTLSYPVYLNIKAINAELKKETLPEPPSNPELELTSVTGFRAHLLMVSIYTRGLVYGKLSNVEYEIVRQQVERQPRNALYQAIYHKFKDGDQSKATSILLDTNLFPDNTLPSSKQRCTDYLFQRDEDSNDWGPCPERNEVYPGVDLLFTASVILK